MYLGVIQLDDLCQILRQLVSPELWALEVGAGLQFSLPFLSLGGHHQVTVYICFNRRTSLGTSLLYSGFQKTARGKAYMSMC